MSTQAFADFPVHLPCLTLWPEWAYAIVHLEKPVENRGWPPPKIMEGKWMGIHAGKKIGGSEMSERDGMECMLLTADHAGVRFSQSHPSDIRDLRTLSHLEQAELVFRTTKAVRLQSSHLVAVVRLGSAKPPEVSDRVMRGWRRLSQWGWEFSEMAPLTAPIPCKGALGLWRLSEEMTARVKASLSDPQRRINP